MTRKTELTGKIAVITGAGSGDRRRDRPRRHPGELRLMADHAAGRVLVADATGAHLTGAAGARAGRATFIRQRQDGV